MPIYQCLIHKHMLAAVVFVAVGALFSPNLHGIVTSKWSVHNYQEFGKGESKNSVITSIGEVKPGWSSQKTSLPFQNAWSVLQIDEAVFIGTDDKGAIYKAQGKAVKKLATIPNAIAIVSMIKGQGKNIYVGTMPGGEIWSVHSEKGTTKKLIKIDKAETIWSLATDQKSKTLYAGTGPKGLVYKVDIKTKASKIIFESNDKRILSLTTLKDGTLWIGTSDKAHLLRYDPKTNQTRAIADFAGNEILSLAEYHGDVIALVNDMELSSTGGLKTKESIDKANKDKNHGHSPKKPTAGSGPGNEKKTPVTNAPRTGARKGKGTLYRISGDGHLTQLHTLTHTYFSSMRVVGDRQIFAGAADQGRIYLIEEDQGISTAFDVDERYIAHIMWTEKSGLRFITSDSSALFRGSRKTDTAEYISKVLDAKTPARFGNIEWQSGGQVTLLTRSGNIADPGPGWSDWQQTNKTTVGAGEMRRGKVISPPGRYFQYKAEFSSRNDVLRRTRLYYLPRNQPTQIKELSIKPKDGDKHLRTLQRGISKPRSPLFTITWKIENDDKDKSQYALHARLEGRTTWRHLHKDTRLTKTTFDWNTETFEDGYYRIRLSTSDSAGNDTRRALYDQHISPLVLVDNKKPLIKNFNIKYPHVSAIAEDDMSVIADASFSIDDGPWALCSTKDGIYDDTIEILKFSLSKDITKGKHTLALRAADERGNIVTTHRSFVK